MVPGSISSCGDRGIHCWWDLIRSKQLSSVSICRAQGFAGFSSHGISIHNIIPQHKKENIDLYEIPHIFYTRIIHTHCFRTLTGCYWYIYIRGIFSFKHFDKKDWHFTSAYFIADPFKFSYESCEIWMEWVIKGAIFSKIFSIAAGSIFMGTNTKMTNTMISHVRSFKESEEENVAGGWRIYERELYWR